MACGKCRNLETQTAHYDLATLSITLQFMVAFDNHHNFALLFLQAEQ